MEAGIAKHPAYLIYHWFWQSLDWLYPPVCGGCGKKGQRWCPTCQGQVKQLGSQVCPRCGSPQVVPQLCPSCQTKTGTNMIVRSWAIFAGPVREAVHRLKYRRDLGLGEALAQPLYGLLVSLNWQIDLVVPVPLSPERLKERGYNQVSTVARPLALATGFHYRPQALVRVKETRSQVGLSPQQRRENVAMAFRAYSELVRGKHVLIVDDVMTTGATLESCAEAVIGAGASSVKGLTLTRAVLGAN
jgi:ComF family protein